MEENNENIQPTESVKESKLTKNNKRLIISIIITVVSIAIITSGYFIFTNVSKNNYNIVGYYEIFELTSGDTNYNYEELKALRSIGLNVALELKEDKTGVISLFSGEKEITYDNKNIIIDGTNTPYTVKDGKITLEYEGNKYIFQKAEKPSSTNQQN